MTDTELLAAAKEIIAEGFVCRRQCEGEGYCGCEDDARKIIDMVRSNDNPRW